MSRFSRLEVVSAILDAGLLPLFYSPRADVAIRIVTAACGGGIRAIEFTNRGDRANLVFADLLARRDADGQGFMLGVGSVVDAPTAALYIALGADFVVGPTFDGQIAQLCNRRRVAYLPGCSTLTEIVAAETAGVEIVKLFPADVLGPAFVKAVLGPRPATRLLPTGGVEPTRASIGEWFSAGVAAVGIGSKLIPSPPPDEFDGQTLTAQVRNVVGWIKEARGIEDER